MTAHLPRIRRKAAESEEVTAHLARIRWKAAESVEVTAHLPRIRRKAAESAEEARHRGGLAAVTERLAETPDLDLAITGEYKKRAHELQAVATDTTYDAKNPVFRVLQIIGHQR